MSSNMFKCVHLCSNLFKTCSNVFKCDQTCLKLVQMCWNVFKLVQNLFKCVHFIYVQTCSKLFLMWCTKGITRHSSYLSQPPQPTVVYFFWAGVLFSIENAKFWPFLAYFDYFYMLLHFYRLFCREFTHFLVYFVQA